MPVRNTACPHCGSETLVNVPDSNTKVRKVSSALSGAKDTEGACGECGKSFGVYYG